MAEPGPSPTSDPSAIAPDEGEAGISDDQDDALPPLDDLDDPVPPDPDEDHADQAGREVRACRNLWNTVDIRPGGHGWFSA